ncbi:hypothetical protein CNY67_12405 [Desulfovibrio sp. G11]|nr:hypothetical protein CNY67_12405 [Desulfovibrio sp. G11]
MEPIRISKAFIGEKIWINKCDLCRILQKRQKDFVHGLCSTWDTIVCLACQQMAGRSAQPIKTSAGFTIDWRIRRQDTCKGKSVVLRRKILPPRDSIVTRSGGARKFGSKFGYSHQTILITGDSFRLPSRIEFRLGQRASSAPKVTRVARSDARHAHRKRTNQRFT